MKKRLAVLVLAFAMVLTMSASVFAAGPNSGKNNGAATSAPGDAALVKYAQIPEGVTFNDTLNNTTFTFTFTPYAPSNDKYGVPVQNDPQLEGYWGSVTKSIKVSDMTKAAGNANYGTDADADTENRVGTLTIASIFTGYTFPRAGEFTFKVKETGSATNWTYSADEYLVRLVVDNGKNIDDVTVQELEPNGNNDDPDTPDVDESKTPGAKVNPEDVKPGDNKKPDDPSTTDVDESKLEPSPADSLGGFTFTNLYQPTVTTHDEPSKDPDGDGPGTPKNPDPDPTNPSTPAEIDKTDPTNVGGAFVLDKYVLGEYGDQSFGWTFPVTLTLPKNDPNFDVAKANNLTNGSLTKDPDNGRVYSGTITLKHGQEFKITELPIGTKIQVVESNGSKTGYTALFTSSKTTTVTAGVSNAPATTAIEVLVTDKGGYVITRNSFDDTSITPTGIIINNLPYVLLIGIALGGIVLFSRKRRYE